MPVATYLHMLSSHNSFLVIQEGGSERGMRQRSVFEIDLTEIEGEGEFQCPRCGETMSPDDFTCEFYEIIDITKKEDDSIEEISLLCKKCGSTINLIGFEALEEIGNPDCLDELLADNAEILLAGILRDERS